MSQIIIGIIIGCAFGIVAAILLQGWMNKEIDKAWIAAKEYYDEMLSIEQEVPHA
jgi:predicted outer membrane lipoprotein